MGKRLNRLLEIVGLRPPAWRGLWPGRKSERRIVKERLAELGRKWNV